MITKADISLVRSLADKKARLENCLFVVEGPKLVEEALASGFTVRRVMGLPEYAHFRYFEEASAKDMERMSGLKTPQGVLALVDIPRPGVMAIPRQKLVLALDGVQDPGNLGTILRTADWFGIRDVFCSEDTADCYNPKVVQASMGAVFRVGVHYTKLAPMLAEMHKHEVPVFGAFLDGENIYEADLGVAPYGIIVMGNEGKGITPDVAANIGHRLYIPPYPTGRPSSESLNVATATAIICSEFRRPR